jgi:hypothetical protein
MEFASAPPPTRALGGGLIATDALESALGGMMAMLQRQGAELAALRAQVEGCVPRSEVLGMQARLTARIAELEGRLGRLEAETALPPEDALEEHRRAWPRCAVRTMACAP